MPAWASLLRLNINPRSYRTDFSSGEKMPIALEDSNLMLLEETSSTGLVTIQNSHDGLLGRVWVDSGGGGAGFLPSQRTNSESPRQCKWRGNHLCCVWPSPAPWGSSLRTVPGAPGRAAPSVAPHGHSAPTTQRKTRARPLSDRLALVFPPTSVHTEAVLAGCGCGCGCGCGWASAAPVPGVCACLAQRPLRGARELCLPSCSG